MPQRESLAYTVGVAFVLCVVCSLSVSAAYVILKPYQDANKLLDRQRNIIDAAGLAKDELGINAGELTSKQVEELYKVVEERFVDLETGTYTTDVDPKEYDPREVVNNEVEGMVQEIPGDTPYPIGVDLRERITRVYLIKDFKDPDVVKQVVLPVYGNGLWSTLYGYLAVKRDIETVQGLTFYEHEETPGLGGEVDNVNWKAQWVGRKIFGDDGQPALGVNKGPAPEDDAYLVDGLSGATITSNGVTNLVRYWVSDEAYGPFLDNLERELSGGQAVVSTGDESGGAAPASAAGDASADVVEVPRSNPDPTPSEQGDEK